MIDGRDHLLPGTHRVQQFLITQDEIITHEFHHANFLDQTTIVLHLQKKVDEPTEWNASCKSNKIATSCRRYMLF